MRDRPQSSVPLYAVERPDVSTPLMAIGSAALAARNGVTCRPFAANLPTRPRLSSAVGLTRVMLDAAAYVTQPALTANAPQPRLSSNSIHRALHAQTTAIQHVRVDHGRAHVPNGPSSSCTVRMS